MLKKKQNKVSMVTFPLVSVDVEKIKELTNKSKSGNSLSFFFVEGKGLFAVVGGKVFKVLMEELK